MSHTPTHLGRPYGPYLGVILFFKREKERNIDKASDTLPIVKNGLGISLGSWMSQKVRDVRLGNRAINPFSLSSMANLV